MVPQNPLVEPAFALAVHRRRDTEPSRQRLVKHIDGSAAFVELSLLAPDQVGGKQILCSDRNGTLRLRERSLLIEATRLYTESLLRCAAIRCERPGEQAVFVQARLDEAIRTCLSRDRAAVQVGDVLSGEDHEFRRTCWV